MEGKGSLLHQSVQSHIYELIPKGEAFIEHRFPGHTADLFWQPKKIVFEIQCSPISIDIAVARTNDYKKMGFHLVWILHQKSFNKSYLTLAELYLRKLGNCYYTNISTTGHGYIYDQKEELKNNKRISRSKESIIDLKIPIIGRNSLKFKGSHARPREILTKSIYAWYTSLNSFFLTFKD
jgi:competence protein CoiA